MRVVILGCGVSGLSCGVRLREAGHTVEVRARELPAHTTSDVALVRDHGHGGAGVTLSWGCAEEVVALVERVRTGAVHVGPSENPSRRRRTDGA